MLNFYWKKVLCCNLGYVARGFNKNLEKYLRNFLKLHVYNKNDMNSFACIFQRFEYMIDFPLSIEKHVKCWKNKIKLPLKKKKNITVCFLEGKNLYEKCTQNIKQKNVNSVFCHTRTL